MSGKLGGEDAPCCSSRVMDPSCLFTTDEGESGTQMRSAKHWTQRSNLSAHTVKEQAKVKNFTATKKKKNQTVQGQAGEAVKSAKGK